MICWAISITVFTPKNLAESSRAIPPLMTTKPAVEIFIYLLMALCLGPAVNSEAADVLVVGDSQLKPVVEIISGIRKTLNTTIATCSPLAAKGNLKGLVDAEGAKVVVALGREAITEAIALPTNIPVIYDLVVTPPQVSRPNTAGYYMATPVREYGDLIRRYLQSIRKVAVIGNSEQLLLLAKDEPQLAIPYSAKTAFEFVKIIKQLDATGAMLLLPDASLLTAAAMEEAYLLSFRKNIPLLGISERHVKEGALLALVVDPVNVGRQIAESVSKAIKQGNLGQPPPSPPRKFDLYLNAGTARKMGIYLPDDFIRMAKKVYP